MILRVRRTSIFCLGAILIASCATVTRGTQHDFAVVTNPPGAAVTTTLEKFRKSDQNQISGETYGCAPTPCSFSIPRRSKFIARIEKDGFVPVTVIVRSKAGGGGKTAGSASALGPTTGGAAIYAKSFPYLSTVGSSGIGATVGAFYVAAPMTFIDAANGSMLDTYPNPIDINLIPGSETEETVFHIDPDLLVEKLKEQDQGT